jgi:anti-sigma regulatory factor (Ser/Thr protein kinase)
MLVRHQPLSASAVRHELAHDLNQHGIDCEVIDEVTLVATELVGNAIRHANHADKDLGVSWEVSSDGVIIAVEDCSTAVPVQRDARPDAASGRGLTIVAALTSQWGYERTDRGKRVWAAVPLRRG